MHDCFRIARAGCNSARSNFFNALEIMSIELNFKRLQILFEPLTVCCSRNRRDIFALISSSLWPTP